jgi:hypothetical protein
MRVIAWNEDEKEVSVDAFFSKYNDFSCDEKLTNQTTRFLKVLMRHANDVKTVADKVPDGYCFGVTGVRHTYTVFFRVTEEAIILTKLD